MDLQLDANMFYFHVNCTNCMMYACYECIKQDTSCALFYIQYISFQSEDGPICTISYVALYIMQTLPSFVILSLLHTIRGVLDFTAL